MSECRTQQRDRLLIGFASRSNTRAAAAVEFRRLVCNGYFRAAIWEGQRDRRSIKFVDFYPAGEPFEIVILDPNSIANRLVRKAQQVIG
jgi:hypothetical protein